jgi:hypothetical protein
LEGKKGKERKGKERKEAWSGERRKRKESGSRGTAM